MNDMPAPKLGSDLLAQAVAAARKGDMLGALDFARRGLQGNPEDPTGYHAFLGMVLARSGKYAEAAAHLASAHSSRPDDITIACNFIAALAESGQDREALVVATERLAHSDSTLRVARYRGFLAQKLAQFDDAIKAYEIILAKAPRDFECLNNIGNAKAGLGDHEGAVEALRKALEIDPNAPPTYMNLVSALLALDRKDEAEAVLRTAMEKFPRDSRPPYQLYVHYKTLAKQDEALAALEEAEARDPNVANIQLKLGIEYGIVRRTADAERAYRRCIELDPLEKDAYLGLAIQFEHTNRETEFAPLIDLARRNGVASGACAFIEALELRRLKQFDAALARLADAPSDVEPIRTVHVRATLLERLGRTEEAFESFLQANRLQEESPTAPIERGARLRADLRAELALLTPSWLQSWRNVEIDEDRDDPVFLIGFPRSGTTLLDTILMGHPETIVMEEQPPLNIVDSEIGGMAALPDLDGEAVARARGRYFEEVEKIQPLTPGKILIDKSPLFLYRAPLIRRLFPKARIILALRHPCDVVLSCFMSNFRLNSAMSNFLRLEDAAAFYDLCFRHWRRSCELFPLNVHTVVYEDLVEDVGGVVGPLLDWLGLERNAEMLDHRKTARTRGLITTASYSQVTEPIYKRASGRWRRYRPHLAPIVDILAPWALEFGYDDPRETPAA